MIKNYYQYINEGKQRGSLYHILSIDSLKHVIETDSITGHHYHGTISTTRNRMLNHYTGDRPSAFFKLELDGDKLSDTYKIKPFLYKSRNGVTLEEFEEQIKTNIIKPASKYINKIIIIKSKMDRAKGGWHQYIEDVDSNRPGYWFTSDAKNHTSMQYFLKWLRKNSPAPIYIQDGSKIYKDDIYIDSLINEPVYKIDYGYALYYRGRTENEDTFKRNEALLPVDKRNSIIESPVVGYKYNDLWLTDKNTALDNLEKLISEGKGYIINKIEEFDGLKLEDKSELYLCRFQLFNQQMLPEDGHVEKAKLDWLEPGTWVKKAA